MLQRTAGLIAALCLVDAAGQDLEPRQYSSVPIGLHFLAAGYGASLGGVVVDPSIALENAEIDVEGPVAGYARSFALGGMLAKADVGVGHVCLSGSADYRGERRSRDTCGLTDARLRLGVSFIGAPALAMTEFATGRHDHAVGASLQLTIPVGEYDPARLLNIGTNRWALKAEIGAWKALARWTLEVTLAGTLFETNDEFFGGSRRDQDPLYALQTHVVRTFPSGFWVAVDSTHYGGGRTTLDGAIRADRQSNTRLGITIAVPVKPRQSIKLSFSRGVSTRTGTDFDSLGAVWQYRWGGGL